MEYSLTVYSTVQEILDESLNPCSNGILSDDEYEDKLEEAEKS